jgi:hypothetical protein
VGDFLLDISLDRLSDVKSVVTIVDVTAIVTVIARVMLNSADLNRL